MAVRCRECNYSLMKDGSNTVTTQSLQKHAESKFSELSVLSRTFHSMFFFIHDVVAKKNDTLTYYLIITGGMLSALSSQLLLVYQSCRHVLCNWTNSTQVYYYRLCTPKLKKMASKLSEKFSQIQQRRLNFQTNSAEFQQLAKTFSNSPKLSANLRHD